MSLDFGREIYRSAVFDKNPAFFSLYELETAFEFHAVISMWRALGIFIPKHIEGIDYRP